ncbi:PREDICTED: uncharacterized protein LOC109235905 [Nicotiana attenuata]|uniref:uncharacterized protein LOC109235905 n=1 Tax=Nicotiana attenuata TaxID=49451 RepID=UPI000905B89B|nr:PREDICTED: uncharacterized protein LOC109235905 [Nicotiana attenuata]
MTFKDIEEARKIVNFYALANRRGLQVVKTDSTRASYKCATGCPFRCYISQDDNSHSYQMKTWKYVHTCDPCLKDSKADQNTLSHLFKKKVQYNPQYSLKQMKDDLEPGFELNGLMSKLKRAKNLTLKKLEGSFVDDYKKLEAYGQELIQSNPDTDVVINIFKHALEEGKTKLLRMYIFFNALKMDKENAKTWGWLIEFLKLSLDLNDGHGRLLDTVRNVLLNVHHRFCARHIDANWRKKMEKLIDEETFMMEWLEHL